MGSKLDRAHFFSQGGNEMISEAFKNAVKLSPKRQYELAWAAGIHPATLSQIVIGCIHPKVGDPRVVRVGKLLGLKPWECFVESLNQSKNVGEHEFTRKDK